jgi:hypothetical protein
MCIGVCVFVCVSDYLRGPRTAVIAPIIGVQVCVGVNVY